MGMEIFMSEAPQRPYSRPVIERTVSLRTETAQRVMEREYGRVENALYSLEVILRIIGKPEAVDAIETAVNQLLMDCIRLVEQEQERFKKLMDDHGILESPNYTQAREIRVAVSSPQVGQYLLLVQKLDELIARMDALWLMGVLSNQQRADASYHWQQTVLHMGRKIAELQRRGGKAIARERDSKKDLLSVEEGEKDE
jgi:hypothetical protein